MSQRLRVCLLRSAVFAFCLAFSSTAFAQAGRVGGVVKDESGQPIKGATIVAENPNASPSTFKATTDDKGRFSILGLKAGAWAFTAQAPGYMPAQAGGRVQTLGTNPPIEFKLVKGGGGGMGALAGVNTKELQAELLAADTAFNARQYEQAIVAYQALLLKAPALTIINLQIGEAYRGMKQYDKALAAFAEVLKTDPENEKTKIAIGMTNLEKGDMEAADKTLTEAAGAAGATREVFYNLGEVKFAKGLTDEAATWYQKAVDMDPAWGRPLFKLGLCQLNKGDKEGTIKYMEKVIEVEPASTDAAQAKALIEQLKKS